MTGVRLLLADDTPDIRNLLRLVLGRAGYEVVAEAANGAEAVELAEQHRPDVVIIDLAMPVMDGLEAIPLIREQTPDAKVVVFSGFTSEGIEAEALAAGAHAYMEKGWPPAKVVATVAGVVAGPGARVGGDADAGDGAVGAALESEDDGAGPADPFEGADMSFVIHELMSPLTVVEGFAAMIEARGESLSPDELRDYAGRILRSAGQVRSLVQAVSDARRIDGGALRVDPVLLDAAALTTEVAKDLDAVTSPRPVLVDAEPGHVVNGDPVRLRQILTNLLSNAAKFSEAHEPIEVRVRSTGRYVEVAVQDNGPGIPPERRAELFQRYSRLGSGAPGMGIGLYISRGIARAHGGDLRLAESSGDGAGTHGGRGACFVLSLPAADAAL